MTDLQRKQIHDIYQTYSLRIRGLIIDLEVTDQQFPVEILNEIRAIMNHLAICAQYETVAGSEREIDVQIGKANEHLKRALFDCYKYLCVSMDDYYRDFFRKMRHTDLSSIDNGDFVRRVTELRNDARNALRMAKRQEMDKVSYSLDDVTNAFENAYVRYDTMCKAIQDKMNLALTAKRKQIFAKCFEWIVSGIIGAIIGCFLNDILKTLFLNVKKLFQ